MLDSVNIRSEKGGKLRLANGFGGNKWKLVGANVPRSLPGEAMIELETRPGQRVIFTREK
jgi:hypothetical protein